MCIIIATLTIYSLIKKCYNKHEKTCIHIQPYKKESEDMDKNNSSDLWNIIALLKKVIVGFMITIVVIVVGFLIYLGVSQKNNHQTIDATGVYNLVNSENGEVIATDLTAEDIKNILGAINGKN